MTQMIKMSSAFQLLVTAELDYAVSLTFRHCETRFSLHGYDIVAHVQKW